MLRIRPNAFETNSSSCHSIVFSEDNGATLDYLVIEETGDLKLPHPDGETRFGWDIADYNDAPTKLNLMSKRIPHRLTLGRNFRPTNKPTAGSPYCKNLCYNSIIF